MIEVEAPDGTIVEFPDGTPRETMSAAMRQRFAAPAQPRTGLTAGEALKDGAAAVGHGLAKLAGGPVDLVTGGLNLASRGINAVTGTNIPQIQRPIGGSENLSGLYDAAADAVGATPPKYEDLPTRNKMAHNVVEVGTMLGAGGVAGAARGAGSAIPQAPTLGSVLTDTVAPARDMAAKTLAGDAGATLGMAAAQTSIDENKAALDGSTAGKVVQALGPIAGGAAGALGGSAVAAGASRAVRGPEPGFGYDPLKNAPYPAKVADKAADHLQGAALDPRQAATTLRENVDNLQRQGVETLPTGGLLTDDPGLVGVENALRQSPDNRGSARMVDADRRVDTEAAARIASVGEGGNPRLPGQIAEQQAAALRAPRQEAVAGLEQQAAAVGAQQAQDAAQLGQFDARRRVSANNDLDRQVVQQGLRPATAEKNRLYEAVDPNGTVMRPTDPYAARVAEIRRGAQALPPELRADVLPERFLAAIDNLAPRMEERTVTSPIMGADGRPITRTEQVNTGGPGQISMRTVTEMGPLLSSAETQARRAGQFGMADNIRALRQEMGLEVQRLADEGNPQAQAAASFYADDYAPVWARGPGDEAAQFRKDFNQDPNNRSTTPPSETAARFLSSPEKAQALARILESTPEPALGYRAARDYVMSDLAVSGVLDRRTGNINLNYLRNWLNNNGEVAGAIPGLRDELEGIARQAGDRQGQAQRLAADLQTARDAARLTDEQIQNGVLGQMLGRDPSKLVEGFLTSNDPQMSLREAVRTLRDSPEGMRGLSAAIGEYLGGKVTNSNVQKTLDDSRPVSPAKLQNLLDRFGPALQEALPPGEMQKLRATEAQLRPRQNLGVKAVVGSDTNSNQQHQGLLKVLDLGLRAQLGGIQGNAATRLVKGALQAVGATKDPRVGQLLLNAMDGGQADTLGQLLTRDTSKPARANWRANTSLGAVLGLQNVGP